MRRFSDVALLSLLLIITMLPAGNTDAGRPAAPDLADDGLKNHPLKLFMITALQLRPLCV
jgi:hypothetical protein